MVLFVILTTFNNPCPKSTYDPAPHAKRAHIRVHLSLTLSSSLHVKGLTWRCYVWNNKDYKLSLTILNFEGGTKPTNHNHTWANYYKLEMSWDLTFNPLLRVDALDSSPHM
jgi:hypothetical protein